MIGLKRGAFFTTAEAVAQGDDITFFWATDGNGNLNWRNRYGDIAASDKIFFNAILLLEAAKIDIKRFLICTFPINFVEKLYILFLYKILTC